MLELTDKQIAQYFHRSYTAIDGLWFMKVEEKYEFDTALEIDNEVWKVVPKIQARILKSMGETGQGINALLDLLETKLTLENFTFEVHKFDNAKGFKIYIKECPWHNLMIKSGREHLSTKVGRVICNTEFAVWAYEFGETIKFEMKHQLCSGEKNCVLQFINTEKE